MTATEVYLKDALEELLIDAINQHSYYFERRLYDILNIAEAMANETETHVK